MLPVTHPNRSIMRNIQTLTLTLLVMLSSCQAPTPPVDAAPEVVFPDKTEQDLPFSDAVRVGHMLYLSGNIGVLPGTLTLAEGGIQGQTVQTLENIRATLEKYGSTMDRVVKCTVMMDDMSEWTDMNNVYTTFFPEHKPARSAFGATALALGAKLEIECLATVD